jgi:hypothetical protein
MIISGIGITDYFVVMFQSGALARMLMKHGSTIRGITVLHYLHVGGQQ